MILLKNIEEIKTLKISEPAGDWNNLSGNTFRIVKSNIKPAKRD